MLLRWDVMVPQCHWNKPSRRRIPEPTSGMTHIRHQHVTCRRYNLSTTFGCFSVTFWHHTLNVAKIVYKRQLTCLYKSNVFVLCCLRCSTWWCYCGTLCTTVSLQISLHDFLYQNQRQQHHICDVYITHLDAIIRIRRLGALVWRFGTIH